MAVFNPFVKHGAGSKFLSLTRREDPLVAAGHWLSALRDRVHIVSLLAEWRTS